MSDSGRTQVRWRRSEAVPVDLAPIGLERVLTPLQQAAATSPQPRRGGRPDAEAGPDDSGDAAKSGGGPLRRSLAVLEELAAASGPLTLSELSELVNLPKSTLHRQMRVLTELGLADRRESKSYELGSYIFQLAASNGPDRVRNISEELTPFLLDLFQTTRLVVSVGALSGLEVWHTGILYRRDHRRIAAAWREPVPAFGSAAGRLLLARSVSDPSELCGIVPTGQTGWNPARAKVLRREFDSIRRTGLSWSRSDAIPGLVEVAAPIHLGNQYPVAAIVLCGMANELDLRKIGGVLLDSVGGIETNLSMAR